MWLWKAHFEKSGMEGAVPAALLALLVQGIFEISERYLVPKGLRLERGK